MKQGRKLTGGKYHANHKKKLYEREGQNRIVTLKETKKKQLRVMGGSNKTVLLNSNIANVLDPTTKKTKKAKIKNVLETPPHVFLARQNRLMKSAIIETELGRAQITNRPTQEGQINAVLLKK